MKYSNTNPDINIEKDGSHGEKIDWKVSSYMEVDNVTPGAAQRGVECDLELLELMKPLLKQCNDLFSNWYEKLHGIGSITQLVRRQSFITRFFITYYLLLLHTYIRFVVHYILIIIFFFSVRVVSLYLYINVCK